MTAERSRGADTLVVAVAVADAAVALWDEGGASPVAVALAVLACAALAVVGSEVECSIRSGWPAAFQLSHSWVTTFCLMILAHCLGVLGPGDCEVL